jgi:two-component system capsular synthesis sensor histidine kinase RcsC
LKNEAGRVSLITRPRVLVIDDDVGMRFILCSMLATLGCHADEAETGARGVTLFDRHRHDLVVTDVNMPGMTGWDVVDAVRTRRPTTPIVLVSGFAIRADIERARREELVFLEKPFDLTEFEEALTTALRGRASRKAPRPRKPLSKTAGREQQGPDTQEHHGSA